MLSHIKRSCATLLLLFTGICSAFAATHFVTNANDSGTGSLRTTIASASDGDTIRFDSNLLASGSDTILLASEIDFSNKGLVFKGLYTATDTLYISGNNTNRIMDISLSFAPTKYIVLDSIVMIDAFISTYALGGAVDLQDADSLVVRNSVFRNNSTAGPGGALSLFNNFGLDANFRISNSKFYGNTSLNEGGAVFTSSNNGNMTMLVKNSIFRYNEAARGGAIKSGCGAGRATLQLDSTLVEYNNSTGEAGGLHNYSFQDTGVIILNNSTIYKNTANPNVLCGGVYSRGNREAGLIVYRSTISGNTGGTGGGIMIQATAVYCDIETSTVSHNEAVSEGGGLYINSYGDSSVVTIKNSTLYKNKCTAFHGGDGGAIFANSNGTNSIIDLSSCIVGLNESSGDSTIRNSNPTTIVSQGNNIFSTNSIVGSTGADLLSADSLDLLLGPLQFNGGNTRTCMPDSTSVAINFGNPVDASDAQNAPISGVREAGAAEFSCGQTLAQSFVICQGDSVLVGGNSYNTSGNYSDTLTGLNGCDSIVLTDVTVLPASSSSQSFSICQGDSVVVDTSVYLVSGNYTDTLTNSFGCDSVVTTNLIVHLPVATSQSLAICFGDSLQVGNNFYSSSGTYVDTLQASNTCDSIVTTTLTVSPLISSTQTPTICFGASFQVGTNFYSTSGTYVDTLQASNTCDSIVTTTLTVSPLINSAQSFTICFGDSIQVGSSSYFTSGVYSDVFLATNGCDSIVTTALTVEPAVDVSISIQASGSTYVMMANANGATYQWVDCDNGYLPIVGETNQSYSVNMNGNFAVIVTDNGCSDTSACTNFGGIGVPEISPNDLFKVYPNPNQGVFSIESTSIGATVEVFNMQGKKVAEFNVLNQTTQIDLADAVAGLYTIRISSGNSYAVRKVLIQ